VIQELRAAEIVRDYVLQELLDTGRLLNWVHPSFWLLQCFESPLRRFLNDAFEDHAVPVVIPIPVPEQYYPAIECWLPEIRVMLILWFRFREDRRYVVKIRVAVIDGMIDQLANVAISQLMPPDLRELDHRLAEFAEPIELKFDVGLDWISEARLQLEIKDVAVRLCLPK